MNGNKMRTFLEIIYNCPFILLVIFTSIAFSLFFDESGLRKSEHNMAVSQMMEDGVKAGAEAESLLKRSGILLEKNQNNGDEGGEKAEGTAAQEEKTNQNAGARKEKNDKKRMIPNKKPI